MDMPVLAQIAAATAALLHVLFFIMESVLFTQPDVYHRFGIASQEEAEAVRPMAYNQGFYNLALAIGIVVGLVMVNRTGNAVIAGKAIVLFACACIVLAAVVLLSTGRRFLTAALIQGLSPLLAIVLAVVL